MVTTLLYEYKYNPHRLWEFTEPCVGNGYGYRVIRLTEREILERVVIGENLKKIGRMYWYKYTRENCVLDFVFAYGAEICDDDGA